MTVSILSNRYKVLNVLGDGGFGKTFLVEDIQMPSKKRCVLKQLKPVQEGSAEVRQLIQERFQREAATLEMLGNAHPQIPSLYAYFAEDEQFYLVQEWVEGRTVAQVVQAQGSQREQTVIEMLTGLLNAIAFIHSKGIVHRDIKPDNIILRSQNNQPVLIDFGAVKETMNTVIDSANYSTRSIVVGTPGYMPVEQLSGRPVYASDIYSLGMTAIYMLTGKIPQEIESDPASGELMWHRYAPTVSARLAAVLDKAITTNTTHRFSNAKTMQAALANLSIATAPTAVNLTLEPPKDALPRTDYVPQTQHPPVVPSTAADVSALPPRPAYPNTVSQRDSKPTSLAVPAMITAGIVGASLLAGAFVIVSNLPQSAESPVDSSDGLIVETPALEDPVELPPEPDVEPDVSFDPESVPVVEPEPATPLWEFMGTASSGEGISVNVSSIRPAGEFIDFEYQIGNEYIVASADCPENRWYAEGYGWYPPQSQATQNMLNYVCQ